MLRLRGLVMAAPTGVNSTLRIVRRDRVMGFIGSAMEIAIWGNGKTISTGVLEPTCFLMEISTRGSSKPTERTEKGAFNVQMATFIGEAT